MTMVMMAIYDSKAEGFLTPFFTQTRATGVRDFSRACNSPESNFFIHPEDFCLFEFGGFDQVTGKFDLLGSPESLGLALQFKSVKES